MSIYFKVWVLRLSAVIISYLVTSESAVCSPNNTYDSDSDKDLQLSQQGTNKKAQSFYAQSPNNSYLHSRNLPPLPMMNTLHATQAPYPFSAPTIYNPSFSQFEYSTPFSLPGRAYTSLLQDINTPHLMKAIAAYNLAAESQQSDPIKATKLYCNALDQANDLPDVRLSISNALKAIEEAIHPALLETFYRTLVNEASDLELKMTAFFNLAVMIEPSDPLKAESFYKGLLAMDNVTLLIKFHACLKLGKMKHESRPNEAAYYYSCLASNLNVPNDLQKEAGQLLQALSAKHQEISTSTKSVN